MTTEKALKLTCDRCQKIGYFLPEGLCWPCQLELNPDTPDRPLPADCKTLQLDECVIYGSSSWYVAELPKFDRSTGRWRIRISGTHSSRRKDGDHVTVALEKITRNREDELEARIEQTANVLRESLNYEQSGSEHRDDIREALAILEGRS